MLFIALILSSMFVITNTMYFTLSLLVVTCFTVFVLTVNSLVQPLTGIMLLLVYLGAIIILIGYICAVSPNFITVKVTDFRLKTFFFTILFLSFVCPSYFILESSRVGSPISFFLNSFGVSSFFLIAIMLFITLLIVTSQYLSPKGPFRSTS